MKRFWKIAADFTDIYFPAIAIAAMILLLFVALGRV